MQEPTLAMAERIAAAPSRTSVPWHRRWTVGRNVYDHTELAGAFGDLGTLIPFVVGYIAVMKVDPLGILFMFGLSEIVVGLYYMTPIPVQPMKAIGGAAIASGGAMSAGMIRGAGLFTGLFCSWPGRPGRSAWRPGSPPSPSSGASSSGLACCSSPKASR
jgi:Molybdate transporter of MFS superfamily